MKQVTAFIPGLPPGMRHSFYPRPATWNEAHFFIPGLPLGMRPSFNLIPAGLNKVDKADYPTKMFIQDVHISHKD